MRLNPSLRLDTISFVSLMYCVLFMILSVNNKTNLCNEFLSLTSKAFSSSCSIISDKFSISDVFLQRYNFESKHKRIIKITQDCPDMFHLGFETKRQYIERAFEKIDLILIDSNVFMHLVE